MQRPKLNQIPIEKVWLVKEGLAQGFMTMSIDQWDYLLQLAYDDDWILLEVDDNEMVVKAYRKPRC